MCNVKVKMPENQCTSRFGLGRVPEIINQQMIRVDGVLHHVKDIQPSSNMLEDIKNACSIEVHLARLESI